MKKETKKQSGLDFFSKSNNLKVFKELTKSEMSIIAGGNANEFPIYIGLESNSLAATIRAANAL